MATEAFAPAKVNLTLHVTGRRPDGYHLLDSLVVFAGVGDTVRARPGPTLSLALTGPRAAGIPAGDDNLVLRAARLLQARAACTSAPRAPASSTTPPGLPGAVLELEKRLPPASGLGGGSADAAAALRALARLWGIAPLPPAAALPLGADVPVCLASAPARMSGIGETLSKVPPLPPAWLVLANPGIETPTAAVFSRLARRDNAPMPARLPTWSDAPALAAFLGTSRNDLEAPAQALFPVISTVLAALTAQPGCLTARMSGSGATCFGLFASPHAAAAAARILATAEPGWWIADAPLHPAIPEPA